MRTAREWATLGFCLFAVAAVAVAQTRKAGLWETTAKMTWLQSPMPAGMGGAIPGGNAPPQITRFCLTQEQIDKYGTAPPQTHGDCKVTNIVKTGHAMTADMVCAGKTNGKGTIEASWNDSEHAKGKVHFVGSMQAGPNFKPIEWLVESTSIFKGADCGDVKPVPLQEK